MSNASAALKSARAYLNDSSAISWTDAILMPLLQEAYGELIQELDLNSVGVIKYQTPIILVPSGSIGLGVNQPSSILEPISMMERVPGTDADSLVEMFKVNFLPEIDQTDMLSFWSWRNEVISFIGSTTDREVLLRYKGFLAAPNTVNDPLGVIYAERFLGPRTAALAWDSISKNSIKLSEIAANALRKLIQRNVLAEQTPTRRKGYRSRKFFLDAGVTSLISIGSGGGSNVNIRFADDEVPTGIIDGVNQIFVLMHAPAPPTSLILAKSGVTQIPGIDYNLLNNTITFITPGDPFLGASLRAWYRY